MIWISDITFNILRLHRPHAEMIIGETNKDDRRIEEKKLGSLSEVEA